MTFSTGSWTRVFINKTAPVLWLEKSTCAASAQNFSSWDCVAAKFIGLWGAGRAQIIPNSLPQTLYLLLLLLWCGCMSTLLPNSPLPCGLVLIWFSQGKAGGGQARPSVPDASNKQAPIQDRNVSLKEYRQLEKPSWWGLPRCWKSTLLLYCCPAWICWHVRGDPRSTGTARAAPAVLPTRRCPNSVRDTI